MDSGQCSNCLRETTIYRNITPSVINTPVHHADSDICDECWWKEQED